MSNTDSFIEEVTEEVRKDRLFKLARRYGWVLAIVLVLIVSVIGVIEYQDNAKTRKMQDTGDLLASAIAAAANGETGNLELIAEGQTFASALPKFYLARHYTELNRNQEAIATLRSLLEIPNVPVAYRDLAMLNLYFLLNINSAEAQELLDEIISPNSPYRLIALEQRAAYLISNGSEEDALSVIDAITEDGSVSPLMKNRLVELKKTLLVSQED